MIKKFLRKCYPWTLLAKSLLLNGGELDLFLQILWRAATILYMVKGNKGDNTSFSDKRDIQLNTSPNISILPNGKPQQHVFIAFFTQHLAYRRLTFFTTSALLSCFNSPNPRNRVPAKTEGVTHWFSIFTGAAMIGCGLPPRSPIVRDDGIKNISRRLRGGVCLLIFYIFFLGFEAGKIGCLACL